MLKRLLFVTILTFGCFAVSFAQNSATHDDQVVNMIAEDYAFQAPDEIPSGWSTFQLSNEGEETHFVFLTRLPEGKTFDHYMEEVASVFNDALYGLKSGKFSKEEATAQLAQNIPNWFYSAVRMGGLGLLESGSKGQLTLKLKPGN